MPKPSGAEYVKALLALIVIGLLNLGALAAIVFTVVKVLQWTGAL